MPIRSSLIIATVVVTSACSERRSAAVPRSEPPLPQKGSVSTGQVAEATTADLGLGGDCPADTTAIHDQPGALVREYVSRDASDSLATNDWQFGALTCGERATSDFYTIISNVRVDSLSEGKDTARFVATYQQVFDVNFDSRDVPQLVPNERVVADTFVLLRTRKAWRIDDLDPGAHRSAAGALRSLAGLGDADRDTLRKRAAKNPRT